MALVAPHIELERVSVASLGPLKSERLLVFPYVFAVALQRCAYLG
jgi:hypothetical protein